MWIPLSFIQIRLIDQSFHLCDICVIKCVNNAIGVLLVFNYWLEKVTLSFTHQVVVYFLCCACVILYLDWLLCALVLRTNPNIWVITWQSNPMFRRKSLMRGIVQRIKPSNGVSLQKFGHIRIKITIILFTGINRPKQTILGLPTRLKRSQLYSIRLSESIRGLWVLGLL